MAKKCQPLYTQNKVIRINLPVVDRDMVVRINFHGPDTFTCGWCGNGGKDECTC